MRTLDIFSTQRIRYRGTYCFEDVYKAIYDTLEEKKYDVQETSYSEAKNETINVQIESQREITPLIRRRINVEIIAYETEEFDVDVGGKTKKMMKGRFTAAITGYVDIDYRGIFSSVGPFGDLTPKLMSFIQDGPFSKYISNTYFGPVYVDALGVQGSINKSLGRET